MLKQLEDISSYRTRLFLNVPSTVFIPTADPRRTLTFQTEAFYETSGDLIECVEGVQLPYNYVVPTFRYIPLNFIFIPAAILRTLDFIPNDGTKVDLQSFSCQQINFKTIELAKAILPERRLLVGLSDTSCFLYHQRVGGREITVFAAGYKIYKV